MGNVKVKLKDIENAKHDDRKYAYLCLKNELKILLVSDVATDKAAIGLDIRTGHLCDPWNIPGLAHLCEHMILCGNKKYPNEKFNKYVSERGGISNAYTTMDHTNYYCDIAAPYLAELLDRFLEYFISPLFPEDTIEKEIKTIDTEHRKNLMSDAWRVNQIEKSLSKPNHPYTRFDTGNIFTLQTEPREKNINIWKRLLEFHKTWYSSSLMTLVVVGKEPLEELEKIVVPIASKLPNRKIHHEEWEHPFGPEQMNLALHVVPVKNQKYTILTFPLPNPYPHYKTNPGQYLTYLMNSEGQGSLIKELKRRGWITSFFARMKIAFFFFVITIELTEEGFSNINNLIYLFFQYCEMMRKAGPQERIFEEVSTVKKLHFDFKDKERPAFYCRDQAHSLHLFPASDVLIAHWVITHFNKQLLQEYLDFFVPEKCRLVIASKTNENESNLTEEWYGTRYHVGKITELLEKSTEQLQESLFHLPAKNDFIPTDLKMCTRMKKPYLYPVVLRDSTQSRLWYKQDHEFFLPKVQLIFQFRSPLAYVDPLHYVLLYMFGSLLLDSLCSTVREAERGGITIIIRTNKYGLHVSLDGISDRQKTLLQRVMEKLVAMEVIPSRFLVLKESYIQTLRNFEAEQSQHQAIEYMSVLLSEHAWTKAQLLEATADITTEKLQNFMESMLNQVYVESLMYGNLTPQEAEDLILVVESALQARATAFIPVPPQQVIRNREYEMPHGKEVKYKVVNSVEKTSLIEVYYQYGVQELHSNVVLELFAHIIAEPCFNSLRKEGYSAGSNPRRSNGAQGLRIVLQSTHEPLHLNNKVEEFLKSVKGLIEDMSEEEFATYKSSLATMKLEKPKKMKLQATRYWTEINSQQYRFDRENEETELLLKLEKNHLIEFYREVISADSPNRRKLLVCVTSPSMCQQLDQTEEFVSDVANLKSGLRLLPRPLSHPITVIHSQNQ